MTSIGFQVDIEAPVEDVWVFFDDETNLPLWMSQIVETVALTEGVDADNPVGTRFRQTLRFAGRDWTYDGEITLYQAPWLLGARAGDDRFRVVVTFDLYPLGTGTRVDYRVEIGTGRWVAGLLAVPMRPFLQRAMARQLSGLKRLAEDAAAARHAAPPAGVYALSAEEAAIERPAAAE